MAIIVIDGGGSPRYLKATGTGVDAANAYVPHHNVDAIVGALPAGTNNVGDADILTLVGDNADLDSGAGADNHAGVAALLPAAGGHVIGGTGANPFRVDPVGSTVMPVSVASFYVPISTIATIAGNPAVVGSVHVSNMPASLQVLGDVRASVIGNLPVTASLAGVGAVSILSAYAPLTTRASVAGIPTVVGSVNVGNFPAVQPVSLASTYVPVGITGTLFAVVNTGAVGTQNAVIGGEVVASTIGTIFAVVNTGAVGTQNAIVNTQATVNLAATIFAVVNTSAAGTGYQVVNTQATVNVNGGIVGSMHVGNFPAVQSVSVASFYVPINTVASVIGNPTVIASISGVPSVLASLPNVASVLASIPNVSSMAVASFLPHVRPYTTGSQWRTIARVQASINNVAAVPAPGANVYNYITALSVINAAASYGGVINLQDGTSTLHIGYAAPAGGGYAVNFPEGLKPAANATLFIGVPVYSLDLFISVSGFQGA